MVDRVYKPKKIMINFANRYKIDTSYAQAWKAKNWALNTLRGTHQESLMLLSEYYYNLELCNPGSMTHFEKDIEQ